MSFVSGPIQAGVGSAASSSAANKQMASSVLGLQLQAVMFQQEMDMYNRQWEAMIPFIEQEMKKFPYEEEAWKYGLEQQEFGRKQMGWAEEEMEYSRKQMGYGEEQMQFGREEMNFAREQMKLGLEQHDFARRQMELAEYGIDQYREIYETGPGDFFSSARYQTAMANIDLQREKSVNALTRSGAAMGIGGEALALALEKEMVPYETAVLMNEYGNHMQDYQTKLANAAAMTSAYSGGSDSYGGGGGGSGAGAVATPGAGGMVNAMSPQSSGGIVGSLGTPSTAGHSAGMASTIGNYGAAAASGYLGQAQAWNQGISNMMAPFHQAGADYLGQKLVDWLG